MSKNKDKHTSQGSLQTIIEERIREFFKENSTKVFNVKQIISGALLPIETDKDLVLDVLYQLADKEYIVEKDRLKFKLNTKHENLFGKVELISSGSAFVTVEGLDADVFIPSSKVNYALDDDIVEVKIKKVRQSRLEGEIVKIIERSNKRYIGTLERDEHYAFIVPINTKGCPDIFIPKHLIGVGKHGDKVAVKIVSYSSKQRSPHGQVVESFGKAGSNNAEMHAIMAEFNLPIAFTDEVENAALSIDDRFHPEEIAKRRDFRETLTFTIDPLDAKDFDDAVSIIALPDNLFQIGVHIADVSHYVRPGDAVDIEAFSRATSVYLVDRVVPMLPEKLSNELCSLRPNEDKYTFSAVFDMDLDGNILKEWYGKGIIRSARRFTYEEAQEIIETGTGDHAEEILILDKIAKKLREKRFKNGSFDFHSQEVKFKLSESGEPLGVYIKTQKDAHKLIEDFMLLANRKVTEWVSLKQKEAKTKDIPFVYRVHDKPDPDKVQHFARFAARFGYKINAKTDESFLQSMNEMIEKLEGKPEETMLSTLAIRTMAKAIYSTKNIGHYGLGFENYTHFTSPIRRYPDLMVHRLLHQYLQGDFKTDKKELIETNAKHCSRMERLAQDAERASTKYKQVEYLSNKTGEMFRAVVSGFSEFAMFVETEDSKCEGTIRFKNIGFDHIQFIQDEFKAIGRRTKIEFRYGDVLQVKLVKADVIKRQIDFAFVEKLKG